MNAKKNLAVLCTVLFLSCVSVSGVFGQDKTVPPPSAPVTVQPQQSIGDDTADNQLDPKRQNEKYRIGFQDTLEVRVFNHDNLSQVVSVSPDGTIFLPRIDKPVVAVCKTERELAAFLTTLYKSYLKNPFVTVRAVDQRSQPFAVIGAVEKPGSFYLNRRVKLLELISFAGGPKVDKAGAKVQVARLGNVSGCAENDNDSGKKDEIVFYGYDINEVMKGSVNPEMQPGDIVSILLAEEAYVTGNVVKPTNFQLRTPVTLTQAIAIGGGLAPEAKTSKVTIQRQAVNGSPKTETVYDLKDIRDKKVADPILQANDIVNVPSDGLKSARNKFLDALKNGIPGLLYGL